MDDLAGYVSDDDLAIGPLERLGWQVEKVSWRSEKVDWNSFDVVVVRTTWDYQNAPIRFLEVLRSIESSSARLENPLALMEWNLDKRYLCELEADGKSIVPTIWGNGVFTKTEFSGWLSSLGTDEVVIKPTISATAKDTFRAKSFDPDIASVFEGRGYMAQPFLRSIVDEGEYSVFYFDGEYSHTILKTPKRDDYRVQEEHGGVIKAVEPQAALIASARSIENSLLPRPLYARIDLVRDGSKFRLMELELIEPALYFRMDDRSASRFAMALNKRFNEL